eukprot:scaffold71431_cov34-Phaeocystis_antarctica.AAC.1
MAPCIGEWENADEARAVVRAEEARSQRRRRRRMRRRAVATPPFTLPDELPDGSLGVQGA